MCVGRQAGENPSALFFILSNGSRLVGPDLRLFSRFLGFVFLSNLFLGLHWRVVLQLMGGKALIFLLFQKQYCLKCNYQANVFTLPVKFIFSASSLMDSGCASTGGLVWHFQATDYDLKLFSLVVF